MLIEVFVGGMVLFMINNWVNGRKNTLKTLLNNAALVAGITFVLALAYL